MAISRNTTTVLLRLLRSPKTTPIRNTVAPITAFPNRSTSNFNWVSSYSSSAGTIDLSNEETKRTLFNRLLYRSKQRGFLELDLVLGKWVEDNIRYLDKNGIESLVHVLDLENPDLWKWLSDQEQPPEELNANPVFTAIRDKVVHKLDHHAAPETRAIHGKQWVRGWDDFKKGPDSPITGNQ